MELAVLTFEKVRLPAGRGKTEPMRVRLPGGITQGGGPGPTIFNLHYGKEIQRYDDELQKEFGPSDQLHFTYEGEDVNVSHGFF